MCVCVVDWTRQMRCAEASRSRAKICLFSSASVLWHNGSVAVNGDRHLCVNDIDSGEGDDLRFAAETLHVSSDRLHAVQQTRARNAATV